MDQNIEGLWPLSATHMLPRWNLTVNERRLILGTGDLLCSLLAGLGAFSLWSITRDESLMGILRSFGIGIPVVTMVWLALLWTFDLYNLCLTAKVSLVMQRLLGAGVLAWGGYLCIFFFAPRDLLPRLPMLYFLALSFGFGTLWRWVYATTFGRAGLCQRVLVVGAGWAGRTLVHALSEEGVADFQVVGYLDDDPAKRDGVLEGLPVLGGTRDLLGVSRAWGITTIVYAITHQLRPEMFQLLLQSQMMGISVVPMAALFETVTERVPVQHVRGDWLLPSDIAGGRVSFVYRFFVLLVDYLFCLVGGMILLILGPVIALCIKLDSPGAIFYLQIRSGKGGKPFRIFKFRSMVESSEEANGPQWSQDGDPRVTRVGRVLRVLRLDELPQIVNILKGDLHLIGPRPERPEFIEHLEREIPFYRVRLAVRPGLTGWAQVKYRYGSTVEDALMKLQYDLYYIKNRSALLDVKILLRTVWTILSCRGT